MNMEGFCESWNLSCISVCLALPILAYIWNISTLSAEIVVTHYLRWRTWPGRGPNSNAYCGGGALRGAFWFISSGRSVSRDASSWSGSRYSAGSLTSIGQNGSLSNQKIAGSTPVSRRHSSCHYPEIFLWSSVSPISNENHANRHLWTILASEAPREVYLSTRDFYCCCSSSVHSRSMRCSFSITIRTSDVPWATVNSDHYLIIDGCEIRIIRYVASSWASSSLVRIACITLCTAEYNASAPCFSITVSSSGSSGTSENSHIVWKHHS